jgi:CubicO group peptidase (beta-lactamase class C family)
MNHKRKGILVLVTCTILLIVNLESTAKRSLITKTSPPGDLITNFVGVINSGNRESMGVFISENYDQNVLKRAPLSMVVSMNMEFYYQTGGLGYELVKVHPSTANSISADLYNKLTESYVNIQIPVTDTISLKINWFIKTNPVTTNNGYKQTKKISEKDMLERINLCLAKMKEDDEFSGAIMISKDGNPVMKTAIGYASKSYKIKNKTNTKFNIASVGKIFTGLAIMQLAEQGNLSYDDEVSKHVGAEWLNPEVASEIQIKHLLTHTSGLGDYFQEAYSQNNVQVFRNLSDYKTLLADDELAFEPGTKFLYSNSGMIILGVIIENVSGMPYFDYLEKHIFVPARMNNTGGFPKDRPIENRATGYTKVYENNDVTFDNHQFTRIMKGSPSGGAYSTVEDFLQFDRAIRANKLLSVENTNLLFEGRPELNAGFHSYGFFIGEGNAGKIANHSGDGRGVNAQFSMYLDAGYTFTVLANYSRPSAKIMADVIDALINKLEQ